MCRLTAASSEYKSKEELYDMGVVALLAGRVPAHLRWGHDLHIVYG